MCNRTHRCDDNTAPVQQNPLHDGSSHEENCNQRHICFGWECGASLAGVTGGIRTAEHAPIHLRHNRARPPPEDTRRISGGTLCFTMRTRKGTAGMSGGRHARQPMGRGVRLLNPTIRARLCYSFRVLWAVKWRKHRSDNHWSDYNHTYTANTRRGKRNNGNTII